MVQQQPQQQQEVQAIVLEIGSQSLKIGYAGDDVPQFVIGTQVGVLNGKYYFDAQASQYRAGMEIVHAVQNGVIQDWPAMDELLNYAFTKCMRIDPQEYPLLLCEYSDGTSQQRDKLAQWAFKQLQVPGVYFARQGVLSGFAAGRSTGLVVDVGADLCTVTPVYEGVHLKKGVVVQQLAGRAIDRQIESSFKDKQYAVVPRYQTLKRKKVDVNQPADVTLRTDVAGATESYHREQVNRVIEDLKQCTGAVSETRLAADGGQGTMRPATSYEFPDGYNCAVQNVERYTWTECLFNPKAVMQQAEMSGIASLVYKSLSVCDQDIRHILLQHVVVTGGTSLLPQFPERLSHELSSLIPALRIKMYASGNAMERKYGAWIGGSILASLGTFQQLWVSRAEYDEGGMAVLEKRCP